MFRDIPNWLARTLVEGKGTSSSNWPRIIASDRLFAQLGLEGPVCLVIDRDEVLQHWTNLVNGETVATALMLRQPACGRKRGKPI